MGLKMGLSETQKSSPLLALVYSFSLAVAQPQSHIHIYISTKPNTFKSIITITILHNNYAFTQAVVTRYYSPPLQHLCMRLSW